MSSALYSSSFFVNDRGYGACVSLLNVLISRQDDMEEGGQGRVVDSKE